MMILLLNQIICLSSDLPRFGMFLYDYSSKHCGYKNDSKDHILRPTMIKEFKVGRKATNSEINVCLNLR